MPLYKAFVALIGLGTSNGEHKETLVPHHITSHQQAAIFMKIIDYPCFPPHTNTRLSKRQLETGLYLLYGRLAITDIIFLYFNMYHLILKFTHIWAIWVKMCFWSEMPKICFRRTERVTCVLSSPHSHIACCATHLCTSLFWHKRDSVSVSLRLWLLDTTVLDRIWEFNMLICAAANLYRFWSTVAKHGPCICLYIESSTVLFLK